MMASQFNDKTSPEKPSLSSEEEEQDSELSLCLSLGGIYSRDVPLLRSSSVAEDSRRKVSPELSLSRTCSLPASPPEEVAAWAATSAAKSVALGRAIGRIKNQKCLKTEGHELGSATRANQILRPKQVVEKKTKMAGFHGRNTMRSWREVTGRMPSVTTTGDGPEGKRVDGFLYKYNKGGHVSIVCVCHGSLLTPAEFVRHAGGLNDHNPMRRIHVTHMPLPL